MPKANSEKDHVRFLPYNQRESTSENAEGENNTPSHAKQSPSPRDTATFVISKLLSSASEKKKKELSKRSGEKITVNNGEIIGSNNRIIGSGNTITGSGNLVCGDNNKIMGHFCKIYGSNNQIYGNGCSIHGPNNRLWANNYHEMEGEGNEYLEIKEQIRLGVETLQEPTIPGHETSPRRSTRSGRGRSGSIASSSSENRTTNHGGSEIDIESEMEYHNFVIQEAEEDEEEKSTDPKKLKIEKRVMELIEIAKRAKEMKLEKESECCDICYDHANNVILGCSHVMCSTCLEQMLSKKKKKIPNCPFCKRCITTVTPALCHPFCK